ncbi:DUF3348 domain-containing protein [Pigmentiphaga humi]|nr:DUF3348 domain-containing protein [Pigmentiphaga humi]
MVDTSRRTASGAPAFVRLLARLADAPLPPARQTLADRLSLWLGWTDAIALSAVLSGSAKAMPANEPVSGDAAQDACARTRAELADSIAHDRVLNPIRPTARRDIALAGAEHEADFARYRLRYLAKQQHMETTISMLRGRLRGHLAARSAGLAQLAAVDAVMERVLGAQERALLGTVPALLEKHFQRMRGAAAGAAREPGPEAAPAGRLPAPVWLDAFRKDVQGVLLAELDFRLQPVEGLMAAFRAS